MYHKRFDQNIAVPVRLFGSAKYTNCVPKNEKLHFGLKFFIFCDKIGLNSNAWNAGVSIYLTKNSVDADLFI